MKRVEFSKSGMNWTKTQEKWSKLDLDVRKMVQSGVSGIKVGQSGIKRKNKIKLTYNPNCDNLIMERW